MEALLIDKTDFDGIKSVSKHCTFDKLTEYIRERQFLDLATSLGEAFYYDLVNDPTRAENIPLLDGAEYEDCDGNTRYHYGVKRALVHFAFAAYVLESGYTSTPFGMVQKMHQDSMPVDSATLRNLHDRNRRIAQDYMDGVTSYICTLKTDSIFNLFKKSCAGKCDDGAKRTTRGSSFSFITGAGINNFQTDDCDTCDPLNPNNGSGGAEPLTVDQTEI